MRSVCTWKHLWTQLLSTNSSYAQISVINAIVIIPCNLRSPRWPIFPHLYFCGLTSKRRFERLDRELGLLHARVESLQSLLPTPLSGQENAATCDLRSYNGAPTLTNQAIGGQPTSTPHTLPPSSVGLHEGTFNVPDAGSAARTRCALSNASDLGVLGNSAVFTSSPVQAGITPRRASVEWSARKRKRGAFMFQSETLPDLVTRGVLSEEDAGIWFRSYVRPVLTKD